MVASRQPTHRAQCNTAIPPGRSSASSRWSTGRYASIRGSASSGICG
jgi:hypothetical protein